MHEGRREIDRQMAKKLTVNRQNRNIFAVNLRINKPI